ncbi:alcohol dehydrogenase catalytic domain-containing protein [Rhodococcoides fascians]|uniref:alcohol dehydrogenase catalytic domain-containing protein n=1 Tax=Rhodococcoides fascians TaxID=1828 RepID=UPI00068EC7F7|nr:alcohol dehydrogenase catalytic domain-containing protein [Rhodococcus fascians]
MKAVVTKGDGTVQVADVPTPVIQDPRDVIVRVTAAAVCGTDLHFIQLPILSPTTPLGHEFIGEVYEVGSAVDGLVVGQRVMSRMFVSCGHCVACQIGRQPQCPEYLLFGGTGSGGGELAGGQAEYVRVPCADRTLTPAVQGLTDADALLLTDTLPTAWAAVTETGAPAGKSFAVVGAGPVGQQVVAVAYALGAAVVYAVDLDEGRLAKAAALGAIPVQGSTAAGERIFELAGTGVDVAVDAVGSQAAINTCMKAVSVGGRLAIVGAILAGEVTFAAPELLHKSVQIQPIMGNPYASEHLMIALLVSKRLSLTGLIDAEVPLADAVGAYADFAARKVNKIVLVP